MARILRKFWSDQRGAVISVEMILLIAILIFGLIAGLAALRNSIIAAFGTIGNLLDLTVPSFTYSGYEIGGMNFGGGFGRPIAQVQGYQAQPNMIYFLTGMQLPPVYLGTIAVLPPAP